MQNKSCWEAVEYMSFNKLIKEKGGGVAQRAALDYVAELRNQTQQGLTYKNKPLVVYNKFTEQDEVLYTEKGFQNARQTDAVYIDTVFL